MKTFTILLGLAMTVSAQDILMKDGKVIPTKGLRRQGDTIMATVELEPGETGKPAKTGELGYPLTQITRLDLPEPGVLRLVPDLIARGKGEDALKQLDPVLEYYTGFRDAPGSWWPQAALLKVQALASLDRVKEAQAFAEDILRQAENPETKSAANAQIAANLSRSGENERALSLLESIQENKTPAARAPAAVVTGESLLAKKQWDDAVLAFVQVPVFYPTEKPLLPRALLGKARALFGSDDLEGARTTLDELRTSYPDTLEGKRIDAELEKIARREKALAAPK